jgi:hypothetical protein
VVLLSVVLHVVLLDVLRTRPGRLWGCNATFCDAFVLCTAAILAGLV